MADQSNGRVSLYIKIAPEFKERIAAWAKAQNLSIQDAVVRELAEAMKFSQFAHRPDRDKDWDELVSEARKP